MVDMQAQVIVQLVDRFTPVARRLVNTARQVQNAFRTMNSSGSTGSTSRTNAMRREEVVARKLRMEYAKLGGALGRIKAAAGGLTLRGLVGAGGIMMAKGAVALGALNQMMGPAIEMERFRAQLEALEGSAEKGDRAMAWITEFAARTPLELPQVIDAYARMKAMGLDPTNGSMLALVDTMAASGKGAEHLDRMVIALGQAWTKQKLQGEEAMQLMEAGVPVWDLLEKKTGKSAAELMKLASAGKLGRDVIEQLIDALGEKNAGASDRAAKLWDGLLSNISDAWYRFRVAIADSGPFRELKRNLQGIYDTVRAMEKDGSLQALAEKVGGALTDAITKAATAGRGLWKAGIVVLQILDRLATAVGGYENLAYIAVALFSVGKAMSLIMAVGEAAAILGKIVALGGGGAAAGLLATAGALAAIAAAALALESAVKSKEGSIADWIEGKRMKQLRDDRQNPALYDGGYQLAMQRTSYRLGAMMRENIGEAFNQVKQAIAAKYVEIIGMVSTYGPRLVSALMSGLGSLYDIGAQWMQSLYDGIVAKAQAIVDYVAGLGSKIKGALGGLVGGSSGAQMPSAPGYTDADPSTGVTPLPARAAGGSVSKGTTYRINERNQEILTPSRYMAITPVNKLGGGGRHVTVNMGGITIQGDANRGTITKLVDEVERALQRAMHDGAYAT